MNMEVFSKNRSQKTEEVFNLKLLNYSIATFYNNTYNVYLSGINKYEEGLVIVFKALQGINGSGSVYLSLNFMEPKPIKKYSNQDLVLGDITDGQIVTVVFDAANQVFQLQNPASSYSLLAQNVITNPNYRFVTDAQINLWNNKQDSLGYVPENISNKGQPNGYASLDNNGKVPLIQIPDISGLGGTQVYVVSGSVDRLNIPTGSLRSGDGCYEYGTGNSYIWDGNVWHLTASRDWANINIDWVNISNKPSDFPPSFHTHTPTDVGLGNVSNVAQVPITYLDTDTNLSANSDEKVPTQKAVKAYVDNKIPSNITSLMNKINNLEVCEQIEMNIPPGSGNINKFYDLLDGTNYYSVGTIDSTSTYLIQNLQAGQVTASVYSSSGFQPGQEVTIQNGDYIERKIISYIEGDNIVFSSPVSNNFLSGITYVYRSAYLYENGVAKFPIFAKSLGDNFNKLQEPSDYPSGRSCTFVRFSPDEQYFATNTWDVGVPLYIYKKQSETTFSRVYNIGSIPNSVNDLCFCDDSSFVVAFNSNNSNKVFYYKRNGDSFAFHTDLFPGISSRFTVIEVEFDYTLTYLIVWGAIGSYPALFAFKKTGDSFQSLSIPNPGISKYYGYRGLSWGGDYFAITLSLSPQVKIYKRSGDSFTIVQNGLPQLSGDLRIVCFSPDGNYLACGIESPASVKIYKRNGDSFVFLTSIGFSSPPRSLTFDATNYFFVVGLYNYTLKFFKRIGDTFTEITNALDIIPSNSSNPQIRSVSFSSTSLYFAFGTWTTNPDPYPFVLYKRTTGGLTSSTEFDLRLKINPKGKVKDIYSYVVKNNIPGFNLSGYASFSEGDENYFPLNLNTYQEGSLIRAGFSGQSNSESSKVVFKITATKSLSSDNAYITKIFGGVR